MVLHTSQSEKKRTTENAGGIPKSLVDESYDLCACKRSGFQFGFIDPSVIQVSDGPINPTRHRKYFQEDYGL